MQQGGERALLGDEADRRGDADHRGDRDDRERRHHRGLPADPAELVDVARGELAVDHADDEEQRRLEERVAEQQREAGERGVARAEAEHHRQEAELADRAEREHALEVGLAQGLHAAEQHREDAEPDHDRPPRPGIRERRREPGEQVDAGLHHRRRVQVGADRGRRGHGAREPEVEREDRRLAERARPAAARARRRRSAPVGGSARMVEMLEVPAATTISTTPISITSPPRVVTSRACRAARRLAGAAVVVPDQQVREHARDLPEHHEHDEVVGEHEPVHRAGERQQHRRELPESLVLVAEVPAAVEHHQGADAGDDEGQEPAERVHAHRERDAQRRDPVEGLERDVAGEHGG